MRNETGNNRYLVIGLILGEECTRVRDIVRRQAAPSAAGGATGRRLNCFRIKRVCRPEAGRVGKYCYGARLTQLSPLKTARRRCWLDTFVSCDDTHARSVDQADTTRNAVDVLRCP